MSIDCDDFFNFFFWMPIIGGMQGMTVAEIAQALGLTPEAVRQRLSRKRLRPISREALYDPSVLALIKGTASPGRPPKAKPPKKPGK
jgi:AcrR family transcriptional regulator